MNTLDNFINSFFIIFERMNTMYNVIYIFYLHINASICGLTWLTSTTMNAFESARVQYEMIGKLPREERKELLM